MTVATRQRKSGTVYLVNIKWSSGHKRMCKYIGTYTDKNFARAVSDAHTKEVFHPLADEILRMAWRAGNGPMHPADDFDDDIAF